MARSFTSTNRLNPASNLTNPSSCSICWWMKNPTATGGNFATVWYMNSAGTDVYMDGGSAGSIGFLRDFNTTDGQWRCTSANHGMTLANWNFYAWTYDASSTSNDPLFYANAVSKTVTETVAPSGTAGTTAQPTVIGNWSSNTRPIGGSLAFLSWHNVVLTRGEIEEAMWYGWTPRGILDFYPIWGVDSPEPDLNGSSNATVTGTTATAGPPIMPRIARRNTIWVPDELGANVSITGVTGGATAAAQVGTPTIQIAGAQAAAACAAQLGTPTIQVAGSQAGATAEAVTGTPTVQITGTQADATAAAIFGTPTVQVEGASALIVTGYDEGTPTIRVDGDLATATAGADPGAISFATILGDPFDYPDPAGNTRSSPTTAGIAGAPGGRTRNRPRAATFDPPDPEPAA